MKENLTYTKERAQMFQVTDIECIKAKWYNTQTNAYTVEYVPGKGNNSIPLHDGNI